MPFMLRQAQHERILYTVAPLFPFALSLSKGEVVTEILQESV